MIQKGGSALLAAGVLAACQPSTHDAHKAAEAATQTRSAVVATERPFVNSEYAVSAVFPAGSRVCEALSGDHPHGFYTRLGDDRMACVPSSDPPKVSSLVIWADYNAAERSIEDLSDPTCSDRSSVAADGRHFAFLGRKSVICETRRGEDVTIRVSTFVGSEWVREGGPNWDGARPVPELVYTAILNTTAGRAEKDKPTFQRFLDVIKLKGPDAHAPPCVWTRGVLFAGNGTPSLRIKVGGRVIGVTSWDGAESPDLLPANAWTALNSRGDVFVTEVSGEWRLCPQDERPGALQLVHVIEARDLSVSIR